MKRKFVFYFTLAMAATLVPYTAQTESASKSRETIPKNAIAPTPDDHQVAVLNGLRDEINLIYGYRYFASPRVNWGPCGRFAKTFREEWNARFKEKVNIVFVMSIDGKVCYHVLIQLPDGNYFDGGNGVISGPT